MKENSQTRVCVLGAGVCGITAAKICLEFGFKVDCLDKSPQYGGLWRYHDEKLHPNDGFIPSVMKTTILNTSKELSAFSDFPPPPEYPNNMKHELYMNYIESYVKHFKVDQHIELRKEVLKCDIRRNQSGKQFVWYLLVKDLKSGQTEERFYDKLILACGHHTEPFIPNFREQNKFKGLIVHSGKIKNVFTDERFNDKRVVVVGFGNSACDIANDISLVARKCYLSSHRGNWMLSRMGGYGITEHKLKTGINFIMSKFVSKSMVNNRILGISKRALDHDFIGLTPKHKPTEQVPIINDLFSFRVYTGGITLKGPIVKFNENSLVFEGEEENEYDVDVVVMATGYKAKMNFIDEYKLGLKSIETNEYELYMNVWAHKLRLDENLDKQYMADAVASLAIVGLIQASGSLTVVSELQTRWACMIFSNKLKLPSSEKMDILHRRIRDSLSSAIRSHSRDVLIGDWMTYIDKLAKLIGVRPNYLKLLIKDFRLWRTIMFGPMVPYQYRLYGPGRWENARETILKTNERIKLGVNDGKNEIILKTRRKYLNSSNTCQKSCKQITSK